MRNVWWGGRGRVNAISPGVIDLCGVANIWQLDCLVMDSGEGFWSCGGLGRDSITFPSPRFLDSVYVLIALPLGEQWIIDRTADAKGKLQLAVF
jgi:hypothetical protein